MPMPDFPVDLGTQPIQTTSTADTARLVFNTQAGMKTARETPQPDRIARTEGFGRYEDA